MELTDKQWEVLEPLIPKPSRRDDGKGRSRREAREVLEGICWVLRTGAQWVDLPERYPPYQTCHRRFQEWERSGVLRQVLEALAQDLEQRGELDLSECFIDGIFCSGKKRGSAIGKTKRGRKAFSRAYHTVINAHCVYDQMLPAANGSLGSKVMAISDAAGTCLALHFTSASPHEVRLVQQTLASRHVSGKPKKLVGDKAYGSNPLDAELAEGGR